MWNNKECRERCITIADILSSWAIVGAILLGMAVWSGLQLLMTDRTTPIVAGRDASTPHDAPLVLNTIAPAAGPDSGITGPAGDRQPR
ncbi:MAG TPA: hypothetical protein VFE03_13890 [Caulobacteraceae bacterium]|jgi:hypothetical protein|nr:hypothetical protein [Caulobacteraceae bacterium]